MRNENTVTVPQPNTVTFMSDSFFYLIITFFEKN